MGHGMTFADCRRSAAQVPQRRCFAAVEGTPKGALFDECRSTSSPELDYRKHTAAGGRC
jgi:hypothetical protein